MNLLFEEQIYTIETLTDDKCIYLRQKRNEYCDKIADMKSLDDFDTIIKYYGNNDYGVDLNNEHNIEHEKLLHIKNQYPDFEVVGIKNGKPVLSIEPSDSQITRDEYIYKASLYYNLT